MLSHAFRQIIDEEESFHYSSDKWTKYWREGLLKNNSPGFISGTLNVVQNCKIWTWTNWICVNLCVNLQKQTFLHLDIQKRLGHKDTCEYLENIFQVEAKFSHISTCGNKSEGAAKSRDVQISLLSLSAAHVTSLCSCSWLEFWILKTRVTICQMSNDSFLLMSQSLYLSGTSRPKQKKGSRLIRWLWLSLKGNWNTSQTRRRLIWRWRRSQWNENQKQRNNKWAKFVPLFHLWISGFPSECALIMPLWGGRGKRGEQVEFYTSLCPTVLIVMYLSPVSCCCCCCFDIINHSFRCHLIASSEGSNHGDRIRIPLISVRRCACKHTVSVGSSGRLCTLAELQRWLALLQSPQICNKLTNCKSSELMNRFAAIRWEGGGNQVN